MNNRLQNLPQSPQAKNVGVVAVADFCGATKVCSNSLQQKSNLTSALAGNSIIFF